MKYLWIGLACSVEFLRLSRLAVAAEMSKSRKQAKRMQQMLEEALVSFHHAGDSPEKNNKLDEALQKIISDYESKDEKLAESHDEVMPPKWMETIEGYERQAITALSRAYGGDIDDENYDGYQVTDDEKSNVEVSQERHGDRQGVYGEMRPHGVLQMFRAAGGDPGRKYYDIGSGTGKTVALAWLMGLDATGIELSPTRCKAACEALKKLPEKPTRGIDHIGLRFISEDVMNVDFSDADLVFANSVLMNEETKDHIVDTARRMRNGSRLILYNGTQIKGSGFVSGGSLEVSTTWFPIVQYDIHIVHRQDAEERSTECTDAGQCPNRPSRTMQRGIVCEK